MNSLILSDQGRALQTNLLTNLRDEMAAALPPHLRPERIALTIALAAERNPTLYNATPQSLMLASMTMAIMHLECNGISGQGYMVPFKQRGTPLAQPIIGYKGYNTLAARNGWTITGQVVREGDRFEFHYGTSAMVEHRPRDRGKGKITHAWAAATAPGRTPIIEVLDIDQIMDIKGRSPGAKRSDSPWNDTEIGFAAMAAKSARRRLARSVPQGWVATGAAMSDQWDLKRPAYIERDPVDASPVVTLEQEYTRGTHPPPEDSGVLEGVLEGETVLDWPVHVPSGKTRQHTSAIAWTADMSRLLMRNAGSEAMDAFWSLNAGGLEQLGRVDPGAAEELVEQYRKAGGGGG